MYCILSLLLFLGASIHLNNTSDFDMFIKLCIVSSLFGFCDAISSLSFKKFFEYIHQLGNNNQKGSTNDQK